MEQSWLEGEDGLQSCLTKLSLWQEELETPALVHFPYCTKPNSFSFFFFFFVALELMDLVNQQGFLAAQPLHMDTARMNLTITATEHDKTARSAV